MEAHREDLRDNLIAALDAAEELPREARGHLADVFLDKLEAGYELVPRSQGSGPRRAVQPAQPMTALVTMSWRKIVAGLVLVLVLSSIVWLVGSTFAGVHGHHPPAFLPLAIFLFAMWFFRFRRWGRWGRLGGPLMR